MTNDVIASPATGTAEHGTGPLVVGIGGTLRPHSSSELALRAALASAQQAGADTRIITAGELDLPMYDLGSGADSPSAAPDRHGAPGRRRGHLHPGLPRRCLRSAQNALDYLQELAGDQRPYLHEIPVGCIVAAAGWQAGVTTLASLRSTVHALQGWPSPLGVVINSATPQFRDNGEVVDGKVAAQLTAMAEQVAAAPPGGPGGEPAHRLPTEPGRTRSSPTWGSGRCRRDRCPAWRLRLQPGVRPPGESLYSHVRHHFPVTDVEQHQAGDAIAASRQMQNSRNRGRVGRGPLETVCLFALLRQ